jgi:general secretion pathway protein M
MRNWFESLEDRDQKIVMTAAIVVVLAVFYLAIWTPLSNGHKRISASVELWQSSLEMLQPLKGQMNNSGNSGISQQNLNQPLVVVVDSTLRIRHLNGALKRSQPTGNNIRVEFENVAFDDLMVWLGDLSAQYALHVQSGSFSMTGAEKQGRVNAQMTLGR